MSRDSLCKRGHCARTRDGHPGRYQFNACYALALVHLIPPVELQGAGVDPTDLERLKGCRSTCLSRAVSHDRRHLWFPVQGDIAQVITPSACRLNELLACSLSTPNCNSV